MVFLLIFFLILVIVLIVQLFLLKKELTQMRIQLRAYNERKTNKKIDVTLVDKEIEKLGQEINNLIDLYTAENRKRILFEQEHKQAIANISHDLRTPLTSILGYIQLAEEEVTSEESQELLQVAKERARRLEVLLKDFFELSIIESMDNQLKPERIALKKLTIERLMDYYDQFQEKKLEPDIDMSEQELYIHADVSAVTRVIDNLLSNAVKHAEGNVSVRLEKQERNARITVQNDAAALKDVDVERLFDRFYMADQARSGKSTGLGLSIVKSFMEKMDGNITASWKDGVLSIVCEWPLTID